MTHGGQDHFDDGHVVAFPRIAQEGRGRGVAGDHECFDPTVHQIVTDGQRVCAHLGHGQWPVGSVGGIADVDDLFVGQLVDDRSGYRQPADTGVENSDRRENVAHDGPGKPLCCSRFWERASRSGPDNQ